MTNPSIVVIGAGAGGLAAATRAKRSRPEASVIVVERTAEFSRGTCSLPYFLSGEVAHLEDLQGVSREYLEELGVQLLLETTVLEICGQQRKVITSGPVLSYDRLIVATGSKPRDNPFPNIDPTGPGWWQLRRSADAAKIDSQLRSLRPARIAVIGGGYVGIELAEALHLRGFSTSLFHRPDQLMRLHPDISDLVVSDLKRRGVQVRTGHAVQGVEYREGVYHLSGVTRCGNPFQESFQAVALAHGIQPSVELLSQAGARLGPNGGVMVNSRGETSLSSVLACGDGVEIPDTWGGQPRWVPLATTAARLGRVCGENAVGGSIRLGACRGALTVRLFDKQLGVLGQPADWIDCRTVPFGWGSDKSPFHRRRAGQAVLFLENRNQRIRGIQAFGAEASHLVDLVSLACEQNLTLEELSQQDFSYTPPLSGLWHPLYLAYRASQRTSGDFVGGTHR